MQGHQAGELRRLDDLEHRLSGFETRYNATARPFTEKRRDRDGRSYPWIVTSTGVVNRLYFYCVDADFGPFFLKFRSYFPYNAKLCINGDHWAQRQAAKAGIGFTPLGNAFAAVEDPAALQGHCCVGWSPPGLDNS